MINNKKVVVIMPAYNAEKTLKQTYDEIYKDFVDEVILVDDNSQDNTKLQLCIKRTKVTEVTRNPVIKLH